MKFSAQDAPHIRYPESTRAVMLDMVLCLLFLYAMAYYYYGIRALMLGAFSVLVCVIADMLCVLFAGGRPNMRDLSPVITGMLIPLMMPASVLFRMVLAAAVFAIVVAKHPFGGMGHNVFNPAAAGLSFAIICFTGRLFAYPLPLTKLGFALPAELLTTRSPGYTLNLGGIPKLDFVDMLLGNFSGPMGATNILVILACLLFLVFRGTVHWSTPLSFFATVCAFAFLFPRADIAGLSSLHLEIMSGMLLFGGVFLLGDPVTSPKRLWSKVLYGIMAGILVMLFRRFGNLEEEFTFALLLMNAAVWGFDIIGESLAGRIRRRKLEVLKD